MDRLGHRRVEGSEIHVSVNKTTHKTDKIYKNDGFLPNLNALEVSMMLIGYLGLRRIVEIPCRACGLMHRQLRGQTCVYRSAIETCPMPIAAMTQVTYQEHARCPLPRESPKAFWNEIEDRSGKRAVVGRGYAPPW
jgi:hypothetical protein